MIPVSITTLRQEQRLTSASRSQKWATQILNAKEFKDQEELARCGGGGSGYAALLWTLANSLDDALRSAGNYSHLPYMPAGYVADALSFTVGHYHENSISDGTRNIWSRLLATAMEWHLTTPDQWLVQPANFCTSAPRMKS